MHNLRINRINSQVAVSSHGELAVVTFRSGLLYLDLLSFVIGALGQINIAFRTNIKLTLLLPRIIVAGTFGSSYWCLLSIALQLHWLELLMNINVRSFIIICSVRLGIILLIVEMITISLNGTTIELSLDVLPTWNIGETQVLYVYQSFQLLGALEGFRLCSHHVSVIFRLVLVISNEFMLFNHYVGGLKCIMQWLLSGGSGTYLGILYV